MRIVLNMRPRVSRDVKRGETSYFLTSLHLRPTRHVLSGRDRPPVAASLCRRVGVQSRRETSVAVWRPSRETIDRGPSGGRRAKRRGSVKRAHDSPSRRSSSFPGSGTAPRLCAALRRSDSWGEVLVGGGTLARDAGPYASADGGSGPISCPDYVPSSSELRTRNAIDLDGSPEAANRRPGRRKRRRVAA